MLEAQIKLECLRLAVQAAGYTLNDGNTSIRATPDADKILATANKFFEFTQPQ